jgi:hypothetical protein
MLLDGRVTGPFFFGTAGVVVVVPNSSFDAEDHATYCTTKEKDTKGRASRCSGEKGLHGRGTGRSKLQTPKSTCVKAYLPKKKKVPRNWTSEPSSDAGRHFGII